MMVLEQNLQDRVEQQLKYEGQPSMAESVQDAKFDTTAFLPDVPVPVGDDPI